MSHVDEGELTAYADGAYPAGNADAQRIAAHLALCENCRNRLEQARALSGKATEILAIAAPAELATPEFDRLRATATARRTRRPAVPLTWAATVILALGIGWFGRGALNNPDQVRLTRSEPRAATADLSTTPQLAPPSAPAPATSSAPAARTGAATARREPAAQAAGGIETAAAEPAPPAAVANEERVKITAESIAARAATDEVVGRRAAAVGAVRGDVEYMTAAEAERRGLALHFIPELEIMRIGVRDGGAQVEQKLPDGTIITIASVLAGEADQAAYREMAKAENAAAAPLPANRTARDRAERPQEQLMARQSRTNSIEIALGSARLRISAPLSEDSLRALAIRIR